MATKKNSLPKLKVRTIVKFESTNPNSMNLDDTTTILFPPSGIFANQQALPGKKS